MLDATTLQVIAHTTDTVQDQLGVVGRVALISNGDATNGVAAVFTRGNQNVYVFDPDSSNLSQVATDLTAPSSLLYDPIHGLLYAMGWDYSQMTNSDPNLIGQLFALRLDQALQDERDFIIESQLMQDYHNDAEATSTTGNARYQTHITIVDSTKAAMPHVSVKLWAEEDGTIVSVDGNAPVTVGPDAPTLFTTDGSGSFTVISGGFASDGTISSTSADTADMFAASLQVWAAFMDPSERIIITPDAEFHGRLAAVKASGNTNASQADPNSIDLSSTQSYDKKPLFATDTDSQSQASQLQGAITQVTGAIGANASGTLQLRRTLGGRLLHQQSATPPKYHAYTDLPGMRYSPVSTLISQGLNVTAPLGISFTSDGGFATHTPGEAADLIDLMQGTETVRLGSFLSNLRDAWKRIKADALKVVRAVVSIAKEVYVGIQYVAKEGLKVIKAVAADIKDAMATIGSFFVQLGKDIKNAVEALSLFLHLDEVRKTATIISNQINGMLGDLTTTFTAAKTDFDDFFANADKQITTGFCGLFHILQLPQAPGCGMSPASPRTSNATPLTSLDGVGATPTTVYNTGQSNGSQAVQCGWSKHMLRTNIGASRDTSTIQLAQTSDDFLGLLETFFTNLTTDPYLNQAYSDVGSTFSATFKATSPKDFLAMAVEDLLELLKAILITGVTIVQSLVDTLLGAIDTVVQQMQNLGSLQIPIFSALWKKLTGNDLTYMDLLSFVLAFPATLMYRAAAGVYPSASTSTANNASGITPEHVGISVPRAEKMTKDVMGLAGACAYIVGGILNGVTDTTWVTEGPEGDSTPSTTVTRASGVCAFFQIAGTLLFSQTDVSATWRQQSIARGVLILGLKFAGYVSKKVGATAGVIEVMSSWVGAILSAYGMVVAGLQFATSTSKNPLILSQTIMSQTPNLVNPVKFLGPPEALYPFIAPAADVAFNLAAAGLLVAEVIKDMEGKTEEQQHFVFLPAISKL